SGKIDFKGQELAGNMSNIFTVVSALVALAVGFSQNSLSLTFYTYACGVLLTFLAILPAWPFFNKTQIKWLPRTAASAGATLVDSPTQPWSRKTLVEDVSDDDDM
ncbi:hypothetical protein GGI05_007772, partial [Coemansia sp. RSA 2603]